MLSSLSPGTIKQYNGSYQLWWAYCITNKIPPFEASTLQVIHFLQHLLDTSPHKYGTFNTHRSALSLIIDGIGSQPLVKRFMKGISRERPPQPKYEYTWDPEPVLKYLEQTPTSDLKSLSRKLITLLALITGGRLQTLSLIRISNIRHSDSEIQILISDPIKTSQTSHMQPCLHVPFFHENPRLCAASTLQQYVNITQPIRNNEDFLFLTTSKPHKKATKQTLSRWVKETLGTSGIDISQFKPHSTRHSSTSAAHRLGLPLDTICKTAGWSQKTSTFAKFYSRPLVKTNDFAKALLGITSRKKGK